jgi:hypothetical protein
MCWGGLKENRKIAEHDIKTRKVLMYDSARDRLTAFYHDKFVYELGKLYKQEINEVECNPFIIIQEGFHSYNYERPITKSLTETTIYSILATYRTHIKTLIPTLVECTIPKGSVYYENDYNEIVSNCLIIDSIIEL